MAPTDNQRHSVRQPTLRVAKIYFQRSVVDCLVLDLTEAGIRISTEGPVSFPQDVVIGLRSGGRWHAALRWQRGLEVGFELTHYEGLEAAQRPQAETIHDELASCGLRHVAGQLAREQHFDNPALRDAAGEAIGALEKLERVLHGMLRRQ